LRRGFKVSFEVHAITLASLYEINKPC
jgi:hypothetical protein